MNLPYSFCFQLIIVVVICITVINGQPTESNYISLSENLVCGFISLPNDSTFDELSGNAASTFNVEKRPSAIIMCKCEKDIIITINWIQQFLDNTTFRIRSGGHSLGGHSLSLNGIIIDLSFMKNIEILNDDKLSIEPGVLLRDFEDWKHINSNYTQTIPHGACPGVAIGGYAAGGGIGLTVHQYGPLSDYIYGINIILCDGSLYQIFKDDHYSTKCISQCNENNEISYDKLQKLLFAIKGGGGGNLGIITKYYFNTVNDPNNVNAFALSYPLKTRKNVYDAFNAYKKILNFYQIIEEYFSMYFYISPFTDNDIINYPFNYQIMFEWIYFLPSTFSAPSLNDIITKINEYMEMEYVEETSFIATDISLTNIYQQIIYPPLNFNGSYLSFASSRLISSDDDFNEEYINKLIDNMMSDYIMSPIISIQPIFILESLGGKIRQQNDNSALPNQNREAWSVMGHFFLFFNTPKRNNWNISKHLRDEYDKNIHSLLGNKKYMDYMDDISTINQYYSTHEIQILKIIQNDIDPNKCFNFELGIASFSECSATDQKVIQINESLHAVTQNNTSKKSDN
eukprot:546405_1